MSYGIDLYEEFLEIGGEVSGYAWNEVEGGDECRWEIYDG